MRCLGPLDLEWPFAHEAAGKPDIVKYACEVEQLHVKVHFLRSANQCAEKISAHCVVEEIRLITFLCELGRFAAEYGIHKRDSRNSLTW